MGKCKKLQLSECLGLVSLVTAYTYNMHNNKGYHSLNTHNIGQVHVVKIAKTDILSE